MTRGPSACRFEDLESVGPLEDLGSVGPLTELGPLSGLLTSSQEPSDMRSNKEEHEDLTTSKKLEPKWLLHKA